MNDFNSKVFVDYKEVGDLLNAQHVDYYEIFNPNKKYNTEKYMHDYGKGMKEYTNNLIVGVAANQIPIVKYVYASKTLTDEEFEKLQKKIIDILMSKNN